MHLDAPHPGYAPVPVDAPGAAIPHEAATSLKFLRILEECAYDLSHPRVRAKFAEIRAVIHGKRNFDDRYPPPVRADLVTLWKRGNEPVISITADGKVHDFHLPPARLAVLLREVADMISEHSILQ